MNILLITSLYPGYEGEPKANIPYAIHYFTKEWIKQGHKVKVINSRLCYPKIFNRFKEGKKKNKYDSIYKYNNEGVEVIRVPIVKYPKFIHSPKSIKKIENYLIDKFDNEKFYPDVILCHMINPAFFLGYKLKKRLNVPLNVTIHSGDLDTLSSKISKIEMYFKKKYIDNYGFRSNIIKETFEEKYPSMINGRNGFLVRSGVEEKEIINIENLKEKSNKACKNIVVVSSLIKRKNIDKLIKAFSYICNDYNLTLNIVGDGVERNKLIEYAKSLKILSKVKFYNEIKREECLEIMNNSEIFAMISKRETLGLVYLEAMAKGCIVIGSKNEGIDGIIKNRENGYLCEAGNEEELQNILIEILNMSNNEKRKMLSNGMETIEKLTQEKVAKDYIDNIMQLINK